MTRETDVCAERGQLEALLFSRTYLYTLFHKLFGGEPSAELLGKLTGPVMKDALEEYAAEGSTLERAAGFLGRLGAAGPEELLEKARDEYTRVFVGPMALPASPYEGPYTGSHDMALFQENTLAVRRAYRSHGLEPKRLQRVPDDHISLQCAYMALLCRDALEAFAAGELQSAAEALREQGSYVREHLAGWLGTYAAAVRGSKAGASAVLYPQMLELAAAFAEVDAVCAVEAAYWAERHRGEPRYAGPEGASPELARALAAASADLDDLVRLRLKGLEDNELVPIGDERKVD